MLCIWQGRVVNEETEMRKTFLAKERGKLKWKPQDLSWYGNILTRCSLSTCLTLLLGHYFLGLSCESKRAQGRHCPNDWGVRGSNIPRVLPFLALHLSAVDHYRRSLSRAEMRYYNKKKNVEANPCLDSVSFRAGVTQTKLNIASDLLTY